MSQNEKFLQALKTMNAACREDYKAGSPWHYTNTKKRQSTFLKARTTNRLTNCVDAVQWGLKDAGVPSSALSWYGSKNGLTWLSSSAKQNAQKYFWMRDYNGKKTVKQLVNSGVLQPGDIITYRGMAHTNVYYAKNKSFDAGAGEGSVFKQWIFGLKWPSQKVDTLLRLIDRGADPAPTPTPDPTPSTDIGWWVQAGAYETIPAARKAARAITAAGFKMEWRNDAEYYRICVGKYQYYENAKKKVAMLAAKGFKAIIKEL